MFKYKLLTKLYLILSIFLCPLHLIIRVLAKGPTECVKEVFDVLFVASVKHNDIVWSTFWLSCGANPNTRTLLLEEPLTAGQWIYYRMHNNNMSCIANALDGNDTPLMIAAKARNVDLFETLVIYGADVNACSYFNLTVLHQSVASGDEKMVQKILEEGGDPNARSANGYTPLMYAVIKNNAKVTRLLIKYGANMTARNDFGISVQAMNPHGRF